MGARDPARHRVYLSSSYFGNYEAPRMGNCRTQSRTDRCNDRIHLRHRQDLNIKFTIEVL